MAFFVSQPPREPFLHAPGSVLGLIGLMVAIHLAITFIPLPPELWVPFAFHPALYAEGAALPDLIIPLFTHQLLHGGWLHLGVNSLWLLAFGPVVARRYGAWVFFTFFFLAGAAGALAYMALNWGEAGILVGASGAISGLMGAAFRMMRWPGVEPGTRLVPLFAPPILKFSAAWMIANVIFGVMGFGAGSGGDQIAWQAHMGGYLFGLVAIGGIDRVFSRSA